MYSWHRNGNTPSQKKFVQNTGPRKGSYLPTIGSVGQLDLCPNLVPGFMDLGAKHGALQSSVTGYPRFASRSTSRLRVQKYRSSKVCVRGEERWLTSAPKRTGKESWREQRPWFSPSVNSPRHSMFYMFYMFCTLRVGVLTASTRLRVFPRLALYTTEGLGLRARYMPAMTSLNSQLAAVWLLETPERVSTNAHLGRRNRPPDKTICWSSWKLKQLECA